MGNEMEAVFFLVSGSVSTVSQQNSQSEEIYDLSAIFRQLHRHKDETNFSPSTFSLQSYSSNFLFMPISIFVTLGLDCCSIFYDCTLDLHRSKSDAQASSRLVNHSVSTDLH